MEYTILDHVYKCRLIRNESNVDMVKQYLEINDVLLTKSRKRELVDTRYFIAHHLRYKCKLTLMKIGEMLNKDHSSIIHAINKHQDFVSSNDKSYIINTMEVSRYLS